MPMDNDKFGADVRFGYDLKGSIKKTIKSIPQTLVVITVNSV